MTTAARITQRELESYLWGAATLLRGTIDAGDYKQFIFPLLFYKRLCDVYDEETRAALDDSGGDEEFAAFPQNHRFQIPPEAHWQANRKVSTNVGRALARSFRAIENANSDQLFGIFGDAQWTNKERLPDSMLRDLIEHFSSLDLAIANLPEDELGVGYEYLIKKFADDSGHTAAEFYTNRTVVHLMTELLQPQPGESIYDPTCGTGGMLISAVAQLQRRGEEWRNVRLYGQERNLMTSSIAQMNCFLHGIEEFRIERGDTLSEPKFVDGDRLMRFDVVLANPPYSIKQWDREAFAADPWGRNRFGTPSQGRADYAFWQHILESMDPKTGRCAILFPHGVLFRQEEAEMRRALIEADLVEAVIGLGPNLFYNASMESCVVICRSRKPANQRGTVQFINAANEVTRERAQSFLTDEHIERIVKAYQERTSEPGLSSVADSEAIRANDFSLKIDLYAPLREGAGSDTSEDGLSSALTGWLTTTKSVEQALREVLPDVVPSSDPALAVPMAASDFLAGLDPSGWRRVRFGDVVKRSTEKADPISGEVERYVAGGHMRSEDVHIREWGTVGDGYLGPAFIRRFRPGQVLYGSRRTYLKKVAVADFDGVTANTTFVLDALEGELLPELLPWLMLSERFTEHSIGESKGSTNPYINWPDIAKFEFDLPPLDVQRRLAELLWAVDGVEQATLAQRTGMSVHRRAFIDHLLAGCVPADDQSGHHRAVALAEMSLGDLGDAFGGLTGKTKDDFGSGKPYIPYMNIFQNERIDPDRLDYVRVEAGERQKLVQRGDVFFTGSSETPDELAMSSVLLDEVGECYLNSFCIGYRLAEDAPLLPEYARYLFRGTEFRRSIQKLSQGATRFNLSRRQLMLTRVKFPDQPAQRSIVDAIAVLETANEAIESSAVTTRALREEVLRAIFG